MRKKLTIESMSTPTGYRTVSNVDTESAKASGVSVHGDPDVWVCIAKAWNAAEGWMKSTKVLQVINAGCFLQVTTQQGDTVSESVTWAPGIELNPSKTKLVSIPEARK